MATVSAPAGKGTKKLAQPPMTPYLLNFAIMSLICLAEISA